MRIHFQISLLISPLSVHYFSLQRTRHYYFPPYSRPFFTTRIRRRKKKKKEEKKIFFVSREIRGSPPGALHRKKKKKKKNFNGEEQGRAVLPSARTSPARTRRQQRTRVNFIVWFNY